MKTTFFFVIAVIISKDFDIGKYPVTLGLYRIVMGKFNSLYG